VIGLACLAWSGAACAESFLVLSLLGDHVTTVTEAQLTDSRTDANGYEVAPLSGHALDDFVVGTTGAAIEKAAPGLRSRCCAPPIQRCTRRPMDGSM